MAEITTELISGVLKQLQRGIAALKEGQRETNASLEATRTYLLGINQDLQNVYATLTRHDARLDRIERRRRGAGMIKCRNAILVAALGLGLAAWAADHGKGIAHAQQALATQPMPAGWSEVKWPFPIDQWGTGRAFPCSAAGCGVALELYVRPKLGFCNCTTGVADDPELDRVGDLELFSNNFSGLRAGRPIEVGWMRGRSRPYQVAIPRGPARTMLAIAFNDRCDVMVATVVADRERIDAAERAALEFLNGDLVLRWAERELGL